MGDCGVRRAVGKQNQEQRSQGFKEDEQWLPDKELAREPRDFRPCLDLNSLSGQIKQNINSGDSFKNANMDVTCRDSSNKDLEIEHGDMPARNFVPTLAEELEQNKLKELCYPIHLGLNQESCAGGQVTQHTISSDSSKSDDTEAARGHMTAGKLPMIPRRVPWRKFRMDDRDPYLISSNLSWEEKVVNILHMVRRREITEYNKKKYNYLPTRFCRLNIAFFDLDKESDFKRDPQTSKIPHSYLDLDLSINVISIKVAKSDVPYPIKIYGTVIARDQVDYRCVYLFKRGRDNPQLITLTDNTLTLTGPNRALAGADSMYFEFHLKIKGEGKVDQDFSKGLIERNAVRDTDARPRTKGLDSCLSSVGLVYIHVPYALEASLEVNILNEVSQFTGKITVVKDKTEMVLYDSNVAGTETKLGSGGSVLLTRRVVALPWGAALLLKFSVPQAKRKYVSLEHDEEEWTGKLGTCELQVKVVWTGILTEQRAKVVKKINDTSVLWQ